MSSLNVLSMFYQTSDFLQAMADVKFYLQVCMDSVTTNSIENSL